MNPHPAEILIAIQLVQALAALVLALLLLYFRQSFRRSFLRLWALSALALALYLATSAASLGLYWTGPEVREFRLLATIVSLSAAYAHIVWLMLGAWEAIRQRPCTRSCEILLLGVAVAFGIASALPFAFDPAAGDWRTLLRVDLRYLITGVAFIVAGSILWRTQRGGGLAGARIGAIGFALYGIQMFHVLALNLAMRAGVQPPFYTPYVGLLELLFQFILSLGIVVWLLEIQRERTRQVHSQLEFARRHDSGTGLPNRELLLDQVAEMIERSGVTRIAVVTLGLGRYTLLQQALGWQRVENLVRIVSTRLHQTLSQRCALGRITDRDLVVIRPTHQSSEEIIAWTQGLLATAGRPVESRGHEIFPVFQAGISFYPEDAQDPDMLLRASQRALMHSAMLGRTITLHRQLELPTPDHEDQALRLENELRQALERQEFVMHFQPIVALDRNLIVAVEALLRWNHPRLGVLGPERFFDAAAAIGMLDELESFAISSAIAQLARWTGNNARLGMSINASAARFQRTGLCDEILEICRRHGVSPGRIELEITESTALSDLEHATSQIRRLSEAGIGVSLDDFGTGFNSLANLAVLPVNRIKLDREFLLGLEANPRKRELVASIINMGHELGLSIVAEGVETAFQRDFLAEHACDYVQGFLIQQPANAQECAIS